MDDPNTPAEAATEPVNGLMLQGKLHQLSNKQLSFVAASLAIAITSLNSTRATSHAEDREATVSFIRAGKLLDSIYNRFNLEDKKTIDNLYDSMEDVASVERAEAKPDRTSELRNALAEILGISPEQVSVLKL